MRLVIQRVKEATVQVDGSIAAYISAGLVILVGIGNNDTSSTVIQMAEKISRLRIFKDALGKTNLSIHEVSGEILVVSQFTLYADTHKGRRPSFTEAASPDQAHQLVDEFVSRFKAHGITTKQGIFGAEMEVALINDGPMTIIMEA